MSPRIVQSNCGVTLVGGGELSPLTVKEALTHAPCLVAADGGADKALALGLMPQAVIGDLDSVSPATLAAVPPDRVHRIAEQETTDFDKCLRSITAPFVLAAGFTGARMDHMLAAFHTLTRHPDQRCLILGPQDFCLLAPPALALPLAPGTRVSLFPMAKVAGTASGLQWPIDRVDFAPTGQIGTSNAAAGPITLAFSAPAMLLILPPDCLGAVIAALGSAPRWPDARPSAVPGK